jgi:small subunit ribosomal protein S9
MAKRKDEESEVVNDAAPEQSAAEAAEATPAAPPEEEVPQAEEQPAEAEATEVEQPAAEAEATEDTQPAAEPEAIDAEQPAAEAEVTEVAPLPPPAEQSEPPKLADLSADARYSATGKRKSSVARVILKAGKGEFELNGRALDNYFPRRTLQEVVRQPLQVTGYLDRVDIRARIHGGGVSSQADAVRHGIAKALIEADPALRGELKRRQLLTRDPRVKERRKAGLKKARKRPQFSKR